MARGYLPARWRNMILPDGAMELIVNLGDPQKLCARNDPAKHTIFHESWISGERTTPIVIDEIGYVHLIGVRLRAAGRGRFSEFRCANLPMRWWSWKQSSATRLAICVTG